MKVEKTQATLDALIDRALKDDAELRKDLEESRYEGRDIYEELAGQQEIIWEVVVDEIRSYETARNELEERQKRVAADVGEPPTEGAAAAAKWADILGGLGGLYVLGLMVWGVVALVRGWPPTFASLSSTTFWFPVALAFAPLVIWVVVLARIQRRRNRDDAKRQLDHEGRLKDWKKKQQEVSVHHGVPATEERLKAQEEKIDKLLLERTKQAIVAAINSRKDPSYAPLLTIRKPRGFGEVFDKRFTIVTPARKRLEFMLKSMPGGSIGIAGSRGAGKTTLLKMFCGPKRIIDKLNDKPVLGVLVSAPVAYEARDFILYLFSTVCQNVIDTEGGSYKFPGAPADDPPAHLLDAPVVALLRPLPRLLVRVGLSLVIVGAVLALLLAVPQRGAPVETAATSQQDARRDTSKTPNAQDRRTAAATPTPAGSEPFEKRFLEQLKIEPGTWLGWGVSLIALGLMLAEIVSLGAWWLVVSMITRPLKVTIGRIPPIGDVIDRYRRKELNRAQEGRHRGRPSGEQPVDPPRPPPGSLWADAEDWLRAIKFQQTFTSGWSGSLKLPVGFEGGVNRAVTLAQNQLSLPEIVHVLTKFLEAASLKYQVIIGIDELDKLSSDTLAQQFLNDIKSIFGLERCFYLISVSENAMSSFERRGLPFRDVFDSSFDDFVYVDHLTFESAQELLQQRVVGRPIPFFALSYCMSGGLARDLIRNFRGVLEIHEGDPAKDNLSRICKQMVDADLQAKIRATRTSAKKIGSEPEIDSFIEALFELESQLDYDDQLIRSSLSLFAETSAAPQGPRSSASAQPGATSPSEQVNDLREEIATYILYAVTVRRFFNDKLTKSMLATREIAGKPDTLAKARQLLGVNPRITRSLLKSFATAHNLEPFPAAVFLGRSQSRPAATGV